MLYLHGWFPLMRLARDGTRNTRYHALGASNCLGTLGWRLFLFCFWGVGGCTQNLWAAVPTFFIFFLLFTFTFFMGRLYGDTTWRDDGRIG